MSFTFDDPNFGAFGLSEPHLLRFWFLDNRRCTVLYCWVAFIMLHVSISFHIHLDGLSFFRMTLTQFYAHFQVPSNDGVTTSARCLTLNQLCRIFWTTLKKGRWKYPNFQVYVCSLHFLLLCVFLSLPLSPFLAPPGFLAVKLSLVCQHQNSLHNLNFRFSVSN